ncbi:hypothetical protein EYZ11_009611 [Aspergillus tanneri]|uniref:Uncharacterized protein n=1 Tax=Aspergillus tanneri TaxID=1220188 RepID=A0A4S3J7G0_9EURO|nr:hypothetical protein EYZ11_009611 [Aspergillus tanneri]
MRTFFNRPPWANRGEKDPPSDFYRRAGQTYGDIVAANKEARERTANCAPTTPTEDVEWSSDE